MPRFEIEELIKFEIDDSGVIERIYFRGKQIQIMDSHEIFRADIDECLRTKDLDEPLPNKIQWGSV